MIKIGIECENLEDPKSRWGIGKITLNLLKEFVKNTEWQKKYKLYLYFKSRVPDDEVLKNPIFIKRVLGFPSFNIFYHILMPLRAMMDRVDWIFFPAYQLPPLYLGKSVVVLTEDAYYEYKYGTLPFRYKLSYRIFTNWAAKFATKILAISETSKKELARVYKINPDKIFVDYLGIELLNPKSEIRNTKQIQNLNSQNSKRLEFKNSNLDIVSNFDTRASNFILFVGQMFPRRHAKETILAFEKLTADAETQKKRGNTEIKNKDIAINHSQILENLRMINLKLILIGPDKYKTPTIDPLIAKVNERLGREAIIHKDYVEDSELVELYAGAKALVYVSDREAFGLPPMEALSFGVPPVITDNELGHELFGDYAFYSKSGEVDDIAEAIKRVLNEAGPSTALRTIRLEFVKKYNWKSFADKFLKIIEILKSPDGL